MRNINVKVTAEDIVLTIKRKTVLGPSASGKTTLVASTGKPTEIEGTGIYVGLNAFTYPDKK